MVFMKMMYLRLCSEVVRSMSRSRIASACSRFSVAKERTKSMLVSVSTSVPVTLAPACVNFLNIGAVRFANQ